MSGVQRLNFAQPGILKIEQQEETNLRMTLKFRGHRDVSKEKKNSYSEYKRVSVNEES